MTAKIEPDTNGFDEWFVMEWGPEFIVTREYSIMHVAWCASIAAHAPKEKAAWEAKEKALRELADRWMDEMKPTTTPVIHQSLICHEHALCIRAILNREQEKL